VRTEWSVVPLSRSLVVTYCAAEAPSLLRTTNAVISSQRSSRIRNRSSTSDMASRERTPHLEIKRSFEIERIASHKITLSFLVPPSPFRTLTWSGIPRSTDVRGKTTIRSAGPALKKSTERTSTGRRPVCSRPRVGRRSASQISPRCGSAVNFNS